MEQKSQQYLTHVSVSLLQGSPGGALKRQSSESLIFGIGRNLVFFVALELTDWCRGMEKTVKEPARHCTAAHYKELYLHNSLPRAGLDSREDRKVYLLLVTTSG